MRKLTVLILGGCLALTCLAAEPTPPPRPAAPNFEAWIDDLGDSDYHKREQALHKLQSQGIAALPALRKAANHPDPEIRRRVVDLIPSLEIAAIISPRRVNLKLANKNLREVFDEVSRQTGLKVDFWSNNPQQVYSFDLRNVTFWEAVDRISKDTGLVIQQGYGDDRIRLSQQNGFVPHVAYDGSFRYAANNINQSRSVDLSIINRDTGPARRQDSLTFSFSIFVEPRLALLGLGDVKLTAAYDNEKNSLLPAANHGNDGMMFGMARAAGPPAAMATGPPPTKPRSTSTAFPRRPPPSRRCAAPSRSTSSPNRSLSSSPTRSSPPRAKRSPSTAPPSASAT